MEEVEHHVHGQNAADEEGHECIASINVPLEWWRLTLILPWINVVVDIERQVVQVEETQPVLLGDGRMAAVRVELIGNPHV